MSGQEVNFDSLMLDHGDCLNQHAGHIKLASLLEKFKTFKDRLTRDCELLLQEVDKYIRQTEFELGDETGKQKLTLNFFQQQINILLKPCNQMLERVHH